MKAKLESFTENIQALREFFPIQWKETIFPDAGL